MDGPTTRNKAENMSMDLVVFVLALIFLKAQWLLWALQQGHPNIFSKQFQMLVERSKVERYSPLKAHPLSLV